MHFNLHKQIIAAAVCIDNTFLNYTYFVSSFSLRNNETMKGIQFLKKSMDSFGMITLGNYNGMSLVEY